MENKCEKYICSNNDLLLLTVHIIFLGMADKFVCGENSSFGGENQ